MWSSTLPKLTRAFFEATLHDARICMHDTYNAVEARDLTYAELAPYKATLKYGNCALGPELLHRLDHPFAKLYVGNAVDLLMVEIAKKDCEDRGFDSEQQDWIDLIDLLQYDLAKMDDMKQQAERQFCEAHNAMFCYSVQ